VVDTYYRMIISENTKRDPDTGEFTREMQHEIYRVPKGEVVDEVLEELR